MMLATMQLALHRNLLLLTLCQWVVCMAQELTTNEITTNETTTNETTRARFDVRCNTKKVTCNAPPKEFDRIFIPHCYPECVQHVTHENDSVSVEWRLINAADITSHTYAPRVGHYNEEMVQRLINPCVDPNHRYRKRIPLERYTYDTLNNLTMHTIMEIKYSLELMQNETSGLFTYVMSYKPPDSNFVYCPTEMNISQHITNRRLSDKILNGLDLKDNDKMYVLRTYYASLLNHTAHMLWVNRTFSQVLSGEHVLSNCHNDQAMWGAMTAKISKLADDMVNLLCALRILTITMSPRHVQFLREYPINEYNNAIINEPLERENMLCYLRQLRDCTLIQSTEKLLTQMRNYVDNYLSPFGCFWSV